MKIDEILQDLRQGKEFSSRFPKVPLDENVLQAKQAIYAAILAEIIGEDERLDIQSDFDKLDVPHLESDKYPGIDAVRQASRNILRMRQRIALDKMFKESEE